MDRPRGQKSPRVLGDAAFAQVYTCTRCDTRNAISVSRLAWNEGVVIGKCMGCPARHMLADNTGLCDETNSTQFSNAIQDALSRGEDVARRVGIKPGDASPAGRGYASARRQDRRRARAVAAARTVGG